MSNITQEVVIEQIKKVLEDINPGAIDASNKQVEDLHFLTDLGIDSLDIINIIFLLEKKFKVKVPEDFTGLMIIGSLAEYFTKNSTE